MTEHQYARARTLQRRMEGLDDRTMAVRVGMNAKEWQPTTWPTASPSKRGSAEIPSGEGEWKGKAKVIIGPKGISVR